MHKWVSEKRKALQKGHRARVKQKLMSIGTEGMEDYEVVEMLLFLIFKRQDTRTMAKVLLQEFGSIDGVIHAPREKIKAIKGLGEKTYESLCIVKSVINAVLKERMISRFSLGCFDDVVTYCKENMKYLNQEELRVIFLNGSNNILNDKILQQGTVDSVEMYTREIIKECLDCGAKGIIMVHNHPSEDPTPSAEDIVCTAKIQEVCKFFNITLVDHIIIGGDDYSSFKSLGIL